MAELADAYGSGPYECKFMQVQVLLPAPAKCLDTHDVFGVLFAILIFALCQSRIFFVICLQSSFSTQFTFRMVYSVVLILLDLKQATLSLQLTAKGGLTTFLLSEIKASSVFLRCHIILFLKYSIKI